MTQITVYGLGGFCADCSSEHLHPLHNIIEIYEIEESVAEPVVEE